MAQTPALYYKDKVVDYTPSGAAVIAGQVVVIGTVPMIAPVAIPDGVKGVLVADGIWKVPQAAEAITAGDAVYWATAGTPVTGTASSGAATETVASNNLMGLCVETSGATDTYVKVFLTAAKRTTTIAGTMTADAITGSDSSLGISGLAGNSGAGGAIAMAGGAGDSGAGGAITVVGGAGDTAGAGGAITVTAGAGAAGAGGAIAMAGGAGDTNQAGGAASVTAGAGDGTADGGAASMVAGGSGDGASSNGGAIVITGGTAVNATTGDGGGVTISGGAGPLLANTGGAVTILSGAGDGTNGTAGAVIIDSSGTGGTKGAVTIATNAASLTLGKMPRIPVAAVVAAGGNIATANACSEGWNLVSASDNTKGVQLPSCVDGAQCIIVNMVTDKTLKIYPPTGKQVNLMGANNALTVAANTIGHFYSEGTNAWYGLHAATDVA